jgi:lysyl-tRNA synthetase class II
VEVETPAMQAIPGGAAAQPFKTFHNALGCDFYLRIALELYHKRLLVGGIDKLFEIGKNFRNEGLSRRHNPEFTMLEAYQAFGDYETMMELVESLVKHVAQTVSGTLEAPRNTSYLPAIVSAIRSAYGALCRVKRHPSFTKWSNEYPEHFEKLEETITGSAMQQLDQHIDWAGTVDVAFAHGQVTDAIGIAIGSITEFLSAAKPPIADAQSFAQFAHSALKFSDRVLKGYSTSSTIQLGSVWEKQTYKQLIQDAAGDDWFEVSPEERRRRAMEDLKLAGDIAKGYEDFEVTGAVFEKLIEPTLIQPTFVTHLPKELVPLAKLSPDDPTTVEVFECCINGQEISPGYTEQNDPIAQRTTLEHQAGGEQQKLDEDFLVALEHGMPPAGGIGIGIDRLCMMLLGQESIRDVILFPQLKPK